MSQTGFCDKGRRIIVYKHLKVAVNTLPHYKSGKKLLIIMENSTVDRARSDSLAKHCQTYIIDGKFSFPSSGSRQVYSGKAEQNQSDIQDISVVCSCGRVSIDNLDKSGNY